MNNLELETFKTIMEKGSLISDDESTDNLLYNLQLNDYIKLKILVTGRLLGIRTFNKKSIALTNQLNIKEFS